MRILKSVLIVAMLSFVAVSCSDNNDIVPDEVVAKQIVNLHASAEGRGSYTGDFAKFSFKTGEQVTGDDWDIAFRATEIIVNGGKKGALLEDIDRTGDASLTIVSGVFSEVTEAPADSEFKQDQEDLLALPRGSWYTYQGPPTHKITPNTGLVYIIKTIDGNYAKMEIRSYYKDMDDSNSADPMSSGSRYYTFDYVYNPNVGDKNFK